MSEEREAEYRAWVAEEAARQPTPGADLLDEVETFLSRFVAFPSEAARVAVTLWTAHAHAVHVFDSSPRLALLSPEPWSGKTRTLEILDLLVPRPLHLLNSSVAVIFRSVHQHHPTLLMDEVDTIFGKRSRDDNEELRGLLNAGHRQGAQVPRCVGPTHDLRLFNVYSACALAGLGDLPDTLMSRSVIVRMRRRAPDERIESYRQRVHEEAGHDLRDRLAAWVESVEQRLADAWPVLPDGVEDRPADCWEPLLAVAEAAGREWPERGRAACSELVKVVASGEASLGLRLLGDLREIFGDHDALPTETILDRLHKMDEAPWGDLRGKPIAARQLARLLSGYSVFPLKVKVDGNSLRGYRREHLHDAWTRYLPAALVPEEAEPPEPAEPRRSEAPSAVPSPSSVPEPRLNPEPVTPSLTSTVPEVPEVPSGGEPAPSGQWPPCEKCGRDVYVIKDGRTICASCLLAEQKEARA